MRHVKLLVAAMLALVALMAFITASAAMAGSTALCKKHESPCLPGDLVTNLHLIAKPDTTLKLLNDLTDILCLNVLVSGKVLELANPQKIHVTDLKLTNCGTSATHSDCEVSTEELPILVDLLSLPVLDTGRLKFLNGQKRFKCTLMGVIKIDCTYDLTGVEFEGEGGVSGGTIAVEEAPLPLVAGGGLCPPEVMSDYSLEELEEVHIST